jgi:hypothetical protein
MSATQTINLGSIVSTAAAEIEQFFGDDPKPVAAPAPATVATGTVPALTVGRYAKAKALPETFLREQFRLEDSNLGVKMPYLNADGTPFRNKYRLMLNHVKGSDLMKWDSTGGDGINKTIPYGLWLMKPGPGQKHLFIVEGESNTQTLRFHKFAAIGISGANGWNDAFADLPCIKDVEVITVIQDPDEDGEKLVGRLAQSPIQPKLRVLKMSLTPFKDVSEMHLHVEQHDAGAFTETLRSYSREPVPAVAKPAKVVANSEAIEADAIVIEQMMDDAGVFYQESEPYNGGGLRWKVDECPFCDEPKSVVILQPDGKKIFDCAHKNTCSVNLSAETPWRQFRAYCEEQIGKPVKFQKPEPKLEPERKPETKVAVSASVSVTGPSAITFPADVGKSALQGIIGEFVETALPHSEADQNCLGYGVLVALGNVLGLANYVPFGNERHHPNINLMDIGTTSSGKGQGEHAVRAFAKLIDQNWYLKRWKYSAASGEGLVKLLSMESADNRMVLMLSEMSILLNSMNREGSNLSGYIRAAYDGIPLQNNKARESVSAENYHLSCIGQITPRELNTIMADVDWYNGVANRFLWNIVQRSKTLTRSTKVPDFTKLADRVTQILALPAVGAIEFSEAGGKMWDEWVLSLPLNDDSKLGASQERVRPNALRTALIYASLDENRLNGIKEDGMVYRDGDGAFQIEPKHVAAAIEVVNRSKASVQWFLSQALTIEREPDFEAIKKVIAAYNEAAAGGRAFTSSDLNRLFSHASQTERDRIANAAGLVTGKSESSGSGRKATTWVRAGQKLN